MDKPVFFNVTRSSLFRGKLTLEQTTGIEAIFAAWDQWGTGDLRHLAYILATAYHETGTRMAPVREGQGQRKLWSDQQARRAVALLYKKGKISRNYALPNKLGLSYYGRGFVQITFEENYKRMGGLIGIDLVRNPDKALELDIAARILIEGSLKGVSLKGDFTKYSLEDFIYGTTCNYEKARQVINRMDKAALIAGYAVKFENALRAAGFPDKVYKGKASKKSVQPVAKSVRPAGDALKAIQQKLKDLGYHEVGRPDGKWGTKTQAAVLAFRVDNDMELVPEIEETFMAKLWVANPRQIGEARANAKLSDIKGTVPGASEVDYMKKAAGFVGLTSVISGGTLSTDGVTNVTEKVKAVQELVSILPSPTTLLIVGGLALVGYFVVTRIGSKLVQSYREGRTS